MSLVRESICLAYQVYCFAYCFEANGQRWSTARDFWNDWLAPAKKIHIKRGEFGLAGKDRVDGKRASETSSETGECVDRTIFKIYSQVSWILK